MILFGCSNSNERHQSKDIDRDLSKNTHDVKRENYINKFLILTKDILKKNESERFLKIVQDLKNLKTVLFKQKEDMHWEYVT